LKLKNESKFDGLLAKVRFERKRKAKTHFKNRFERERKQKLISKVDLRDIDLYVKVNCQVDKQNQG